MTSSAWHATRLLVRTWTHAYTLGLPQSIRERRRAEIESDLWELEHDLEAGSPARRARQVLARLSAGVADDLCWCLETTCEQGGATFRRTVAAAGIVTVLLTILAWSSSGAPSGTGSPAVTDCASRYDAAESNVDLRLHLVECAGAFFVGTQAAR